MQAKFEIAEKNLTPQGFPAHDEFKTAMEIFLALDEFQKIDNLIGIISNLNHIWNFNYKNKVFKMKIGILRANEIYKILLLKMW